MARQIVTNSTVLPGRSANRQFSLAASWPELAACAALVFTYLLLRDMSLNHDVVWQMWIGRQLYHGTALYTELLELNPPLWFWIATPLAGFAEVSGASPGSVLVGFMTLAIGVSMALFSTLLADKPPAVRAALLASIYAVATVTLLNDFGQREHFTLVTTLPYVALVARRMEGRSIPVALAITVGLFAASGFALKHYFAIVPLALEILSFARNRTAYRALRPETAALFGFAAAYAAAVLVFAPDFLRTMVPMVNLAYHGYERPLARQLETSFFFILPIAACIYALGGRPRSTLALAAFTAMIGFLAAYFLQQKGWRYHALPMTGLLIFGVMAEFVARREFADGKLPAADRRSIFFLLPTVAIPILVGLLDGPYANRFSAPIGQALAPLRPGETVLTLSANATAMWPMVEERELVFPSRHFTFWMLSAIARDEKDGKPSPELQRLGAAVRRQTVEDIACNPPRLIVVDSHSGAASMEGLKFDTLAFFRRDEAFSALFSSYRLVGRYGPDGRFTAYRRLGRMAPPERLGCRKIH